MRQMKKSQKKNREKFIELNFLRQTHGLRQRVATQAIFAARWRRDNFKKIASPSQAKNRSCSRGFTKDNATEAKNNFIVERNCSKEYSVVFLMKGEKSVLLRTRSAQRLSSQLLAAVAMPNIAELVLSVFFFCPQPWFLWWSEHIVPRKNTTFSCR